MSQAVRLAPEIVLWSSGWVRAEMFASISFLWQSLHMTTINEIPVGTFVKITICDVSEEAVKKSCNDYMGSYPYEGYMTHFGEVDYDPTHGYCVVGDRLASCD